MDYPVIGDLLRFLLNGVRVLPGWILRRIWPKARIQSRIEVFHFDSAPQFFIGTERTNHELQYGGFNVCNYTPLTMAIVGVDLRYSVDNQEFAREDRRLSRRLPLPRYARGGYAYQISLPAPLVLKMQKMESDSVLLHIDGHLIVDTIHGELNIEVRKNVATLIGRDRLRNAPL